MQARELRPGTAIVLRGEIYIVTDFRISTPGNKRGFVQATIQSIKTGKNVQNRFSSSEEVQRANLDSNKCQYLYHDHSGHHFMNLTDFNSFPLPDNLVGEKKYYLKENDEVVIDFYEGAPIMLEVPNHVFLKLTEAPPWVKGDSVSNNTKPAVTETGLKLQVPIFLKEGEMIKVDTRTGEYLGRK